MENKTRIAAFICILRADFLLSTLVIAMAARPFCKRLQQNGGRKKKNCIAWWVLSEWVVCVEWVFGKCVGNWNRKLMLAKELQDFKENVKNI